MLLLPTTTFPNDSPAGTADMLFPAAEFEPDDPPEGDPLGEEELLVGAPDFTLAQPPSATRAIEEISSRSASLFMRFPAAVS